jgi:transposase InsO family protein
MNVPAHNRRYSSTARHRTSARAKSKNNLERVPQAALGTECGGGLFHHRSLDKQRTNSVSGPLLHQFVSRKVAIAGIASRANGLWISQVGRHVTDAVDGILDGKRFLIHDRDPLFTAEFQGLLVSAGVKCVKLPPQSPNLNAYAEHFVRSIKESCLDRLILFGGHSLQRAMQEFVMHYHHERNHQGLGN